MPKEDIKVDKKDKQLLYLLDVNGRLPYSQLAKKVRISKQLVKYRVERLEKLGVIKGYHPMVDLTKLGIITFRIYLKLRNVTQQRRTEIIDYLKEESKTWAVIRNSGPWDIGFALAVKDIHEFYEVWDKLLGKYLENIADFTTSIYSPIYHYSAAYITGKKDLSPIRILGGKGSVDIDKKDYQILQALSTNARKSLLKIGQEIGMSAELVSYRIKNLVKSGVIQGYRATIDVAKFGYHFYKTEVRLSNYKNFKALMHYCHQHPNIYQVDRTIGGETIEIEFHVQRLQEMHDIMEDIERQLPNSIERWDYFEVLGIEKIEYFPKIDF